MEDVMLYKQLIEKLIKEYPLNIDTEARIECHIPTSVSSEFITNKEQGDWAEKLIFSVINDNLEKFCAVKYGKNDNISAGDKGFKKFYLDYIYELNTIGKRPDILIFKKKDYKDGIELNDELIGKAICAIEIRSSSFLVNKYEDYMNKRSKDALDKIKILRNKIFNSDILSDLLCKKNKIIYDYLSDATDESYGSMSF